MFKAMKFKVEDAEQSEQLQKVLFGMGYYCHANGYSEQDYILTTEEDGSSGYGPISVWNSETYEDNKEMDTAAFILEHTEKPVSEEAVQISDKPASEKTISLSTLLNEHGTPNARDLLLKAAQGPVGVNDKQPALIQAVGAYNALTGQNMTVAEGNLFMALAHVASAEGDEESALGYLARYLVETKA